jgi:hypothetical protein
MRLLHGGVDERDLAQAFRRALEQEEVRYGAFNLFSPVPFEDEGLSGIGECSPMNAPVIAAPIRHSLAPLAVGEDPTRIEWLPALSPLCGPVSEDHLAHRSLSLNRNVEHGFTRLEIAAPRLQLLDDLPEGGHHARVELLAAMAPDLGQRGGE